MERIYAGFTTLNVIGYVLTLELFACIFKEFVAAVGVNKNTSPLPAFGDVQLDGVTDQTVFE